MVHEDSDRETSRNSEADQEDQKGRIETRKDKMKEFIKRKLKPVHEEIIAPPGE
jgi:hypothetical protein